jgi:hypothetical protein
MCEAMMFLSDKESTAATAGTARVGNCSFGVGQGGTLDVGTHDFSATYECTEGGTYYISFFFWGIASCDVTVKNISLKGIDPNAIDATERVVNGALTSNAGWTSAGGGPFGWIGGLNVAYGADGIEITDNVDDGVGGNGYIAQQIRLQKGVNYKLSYWTKSEDLVVANGGNQQYVAVRKFEQMVNGSPFEDFGKVQADVNNDAEAATFDWVKREVSFTVPATGEYTLIVHFYEFTSGKLWYKDVSVKYDATVVNETFAEGATFVTCGWENGSTVGIDTTVSATEDGTGCYKVIGGNGDINKITSFFNFTVAVKKGTYTISYKYRVDNAANYGTDAFFKLYQGEGSTDILENRNPANIYWDCLTTGVWGTFTATFTVTEDTTVKGHWQMYGLGGDLYLDDIVITAVV